MRTSTRRGADAMDGEGGEADAEQRAASPPSERGAGDADEPTRERSPRALRRQQTMEYISALHLQDGRPVQSLEDQPKLREALRHSSGVFTKRIDPVQPPPHAYNRVPCKITDYVDDVAAHLSPLAQSADVSPNIFASNQERTLLDLPAHRLRDTVSREFVRAGPRQSNLHDPARVKAAIVACDGLCPGINTVVREIYLSLTRTYGVEEVYAVPYGYTGFYSPVFEIKKLSEEDVSDIHHEGGCVLGCSRGGCETKMIVDAIVDFEFSMVFIIGGDSTHRGAVQIFEEIKRRRLPIAVVGIPKSVDNDIALIDRSFGFATAVEEVQRAIHSAKTEATSAFNGIGMVKLPGRHSGHLTTAATVASRDVDVCLIPEVPFFLEGDKGLLSHIHRLLRRRGHCVILVAEGAGANLMNDGGGDGDDDDDGGDKAGCTRLFPPSSPPIGGGFQHASPPTRGDGRRPRADIGVWLKARINAHFERRGEEVNLKYIDPTYMIRNVPPNAADKLYCAQLAQNAVHGAFAGYTGFSVGLVNTHYVYIPMLEIARGRAKVDVYARTWQHVVSSTGQPKFEEAVRAADDAS